MDLRQAMHQGISRLAKHIDILQATGDAAHSLLRPNEEEIEDLACTEEDETLGKDITTFFETQIPRNAGTHRSTPPLPRTEHHVFPYFLDGSAHGRAIGTGIEGPRSFPLALFQIGAAVIQRDHAGNLRPLAIEHRIIQTVQAGADGMSPSLWDRLLGEEDALGIFQTIKIEPKISKAGIRSDSQDVRARSNSLAFAQMHKLELQFCERLTPHLSLDTRAIIDGSVKIGSLVSCPFVVGVAKSFWTMPRLQLQTGVLKPLNLTRLLAELPPEHRTPVFTAAGGNVGFWYVRLRHILSTYPLDGIVKVEIPRPTQNPVDSDEADFLSRALVAERTVSPYGLDKRWHRLLYPIHHAEQLIKRGFVSEQVIDHIIQAVMLKTQYR